MDRGGDSKKWKRHKSIDMARINNFSTETKRYVFSKSLHRNWFRNSKSIESKLHSNKLIQSVLPNGCKREWEKNTSLFILAENDILISRAKWKHLHFTCKFLNRRKWIYRVNWTELRMFIWEFDNWKRFDCMKYALFLLSLFDSNLYGRLFIRRLVPFSWFAQSKRK